MNELEIKENKKIKQISKDFRGMKERFKSASLKNLQAAFSLFQTDIFKAYQINDINLNETVRKSYQETELVIKNRLLSKTEKFENELREMLFVMDALKHKFDFRAARMYD